MRGGTPPLSTQPTCPPTTPASPEPPTPEEATALLDAAVVRLGERGLATSRDVFGVSLPRTDVTTPA
jgi:hypothetical protein